MKIILELKDDQYTYNGIKRVRDSCRGVVVNEEGKIALTHLYRESDAFGGRDYYELPGGGRNEGETTLVAAMREMEEELGVQVELIKELGIVHDYYNLIFQENYSYYYLFKVIDYTAQRLEPRESLLIDRIEWLSVEEAIKAYESFTKDGVGLLVKRRELPILKLVKNYLRQ